MGSCYELQVFLSDRWTHLLYDRAGKLCAYDRGYLPRIELVSCSRTSKIRVFLKRLLRVVAGAIQVGHEGANNEETAKVGGLHRLYRSHRLLVVHGLSGP
jgi:hypothetical protein